MRLLTALGFAVLATCPPAVAGETAWQELAPGVSIRLISAGKVLPSGKALLALEIDMPETTKTYWRVPGEGGLPIDIDLTASRGVEAHSVLWPYPSRTEKAGNLDYAYYGHTVLPIEVSVADKHAQVDMHAVLGICSEICIPAQARFTLPLADERPDAANGLRIKLALAEVPIGWTDGPEPIGGVALMPGGDAIGIKVDSDALEPASIIAATQGGEPLFGTPQKSPHTDLVVLPILGKSDNSALEGVDVEVTFMTEMGAYVVNRTIEAGNDVSAAVLGQ